MKRCLVICAQPPSAKASQAGHMVAYHFLMGLTSEYNVDAVFVINKGQSGDISIDANRVSIKRVFEVSKFRKFINIILNIFSVPPRFSTRLSSSIIQEIQNIIESEKYDLLHFEFSQALTFLPFLKFSGETSATMHDLQCQVVIRSSGILDVFFTRQTILFEGQLLRLLDNVCVLSEKDSMISRGLYLCPNVTIKPPALSGFIQEVRRDRNKIEPYSILFWGAMNRPENEEAILFFIENIFFPIRDVFPYVKLYIVGNKPSQNIISKQCENIIVTGFLDDPSDFFSKCALGIAPLQRGAGIKIKTLEMLAVGMPVFATEVGAEGIRHENLTTIDISEFQENIVTFFREKSG